MDIQDLNTKKCRDTNNGKIEIYFNFHKMFLFVDKLKSYWYFSF